MFDFVRTHQRLMQLILLLLIFPSFAFFGLESYTRMSSRGDEVANVAGQPVTQAEFDAAQREQMDRFRQMFGERFDPKMVDTPEFRAGILENLVAQRALEATVQRDNLTVSTGALQEVILRIPGLTGADGKFDGERYKALLAAQGMTPAIFEARMARDMAVQQVNAAVQTTAFAPKAVANRLSDLNDQEREVQELLFKAADYAGKVTVTDEMVKAYYDKNPKLFEVPESAKIEYVVLDLDAAAAQITVSDDDIKSYYTQNQKRYTTEEQRRASHILISSKKDKAAAKAKAEGILAKVKKNPAEFAALAKANSEDPGSAEKGGDLDFFGRGMMVKPFEEAAFSLKQGEISGLVESDFGFHIIQLTGIKPGAVKTLDEVKGEIAGEIKKQLASKKFSEMAETFSNTIYEQADSLKPVADKLKLTVRTAANIARTPNPAVDPKAATNNAKFLTALFSDEVLKNKHNTEAVEVAPNTVVAGRIVEYKPVTKSPLEEVKEGVKSALVREESQKLAVKAGQDKLAGLKAKDDTAGFGETKTVNRVKGQLGAATAEVMKADTAKLPAFVGVESPGQGYAVYRITKVSQPAQVDAARRQAEQQQIANAMAQQEMLAYLEVLKEKAKARITPKAATPAKSEDTGTK